LFGGLSPPKPPRGDGTVSCCVTCQDVCVNSQMQGSHSVISKKPRLHTQIIPYLYNKTGPSPAGGKWCPPHLKYMLPFYIWPPSCCIHPILYLKNVSPPCSFGTPLLRNSGGVSERKPRKFVLRRKTYECASFI